MNAIWRTIRGYILWQYERGTLHYDIMVTLIILFVLFSPRVINFNDKPIARNPHPTNVMVTADADGRLFYQVSASAVVAGDAQVGAGTVAAYYRTDFGGSFDCEL